MKIPKRSFEASVPSMAMGDIAFLLLIFFVILARAQDDSHLKWQPAKAEELEQAKHHKASVVIDVGNKYYLNGKELENPSQKGKLDKKDLTNKLKVLLGEDKEDRTVLLKVHKETKAERFEPVIEAISAAGAEIHHVLEQENN
tara:strand:- start:1086 stop:1514 length:429 start_codon:yes stop_codon:yes gene_type:complete